MQRLLPDAVAAEADVQVESAESVGAALSADDQVALVGSDPRLDLAEARVDRVAEVLSRLVDAVDETRDPDVVAALAAAANGAEVQVSIRGDRRRPLDSLGRAHRRAEMPRRAPITVSGPLGEPDVVVLAAVPEHDTGVGRQRTVRDPVDPRAVG